MESDREEHWKKVPGVLSNWVVLKETSKQGPESRGPWTKAFKGEKNGNQHLKSNVTRQILWNKVSMSFIGILMGYVEYEPLCQCRRHERHGFAPWVRKMPWRSAWQPTPVFFPGESQGRGILVGCRLWGTQSRTLLKLLSSSSSMMLDGLPRWC